MRLVYWIAERAWLYYLLVLIAATVIGSTVAVLLTGGSTP